MKRIIVTLIGIIVLQSVFAENNTENKVNELTDRINEFNYLYPQEKVYLHFDNTGYFLNETIWFKAYVTQADNNRLSQHSKVLYTELIGPEGTVIESKKYKLDEGKANGDFRLPDSLFAGFYEVRAYTRAMLNWGDEVVFTRVFPVFNNPEITGNFENKQMTVRHHSRNIPVTRKKEPKLNNINIEFYPEGGNLIAEVMNRIAFKVTDKNGKSIHIEGIVRDSVGGEITKLKTYHNGMGSFTLTPDGRKMTIHLNHEGKEHIFNLPSAEMKGYSMQINNIVDGYTLLQIEKHPQQPDITLGLSVTCRGMVSSVNTFEIGESGKYSLRIPKEHLSEGVNQITLFDENGNVFCERMIFINHNTNPIVLTNTNLLQEGTPYGKINIEFTAQDLTGSPTEIDFSVSVRDASNLIETYNTDNIKINLLLSSELKGFIDDPAYYFEADDIRRRTALDHLMLVQGWRRYDWKQMAGIEPFEVKYGIEDQLVVEGHISSIFKKNREKDMDIGMVMINMQQGKSQHGTCITDENGEFNFGLGEIYGKWKLTLHAKKKNKYKHCNIIINRNISPVPKFLNYYEQNIPDKNKENNINLKGLTRTTDFPKAELIKKDTDYRALTDSIPSIRSYVLDPVVITEKRKRTIKDLALRQANIVYDVVNEVDQIIDNNEYYVDNLMDILWRINPYFISSTDEKGRDIYKYKGRKVMVYVDNMPPTDIIYVSDIESVVISEKDNVILPDGKVAWDNEVVVFVFTKDGRNHKGKNGVRETVFYGYNRPREFYNPQYDYTELPEAEDYRRTLYWNPEVKTDKNGKANISFYNNGKCKELDISAEGISNTGIPIVLQQ